MYDIIDSFRGDYAFLSNFSPSAFVHEHVYYEPDEISGSSIIRADKLHFVSVEQFFHYQKALCFSDHKTAQKILETFDPAKSKKLGRQIKGFNKNIWLHTSIKAMNKGLVYKFIQNKDLKELLLKTYPKILIEGNTWGDKFWGMVDGEGQNWLGVLLMKLRNQFIITGDPNEALWWEQF